MKVTVICVGKIKEKFYQDAIAEYSKRLSRYIKLDIIEVADEKTPDDINSALALKVKEKEGDKILSHIKDGTYLITLEIKGKKLTSEGLADKIKGLMDSGSSDITFVIGGSLGLSESVTKKSDLALSFSDMTFPHQLMRVILLEQVYRSFRIMNNEPYHK